MISLKSTFQPNTLSTAPCLLAGFFLVDFPPQLITLARAHSSLSGKQNLTVSWTKNSSFHFDFVMDFLGLEVFLFLFLIILIPTLTSVYCWSILLNLLIPHLGVLQNDWYLFSHHVFHQCLFCQFLILFYYLPFSLYILQLRLIDFHVW